jgi:2-polyprenyl-6-methoxyphenol hydroxylase-like FAD-dependent oxidoreductase
MSLPTTTPLKVLISGAGIAGPCLAYWLSRISFPTSITIVERSPILRPTGQAIDIRGPAISVIRKMGLEEAVKAKHTTEEGTRIVNTSGVVIAEFGKGKTFTAEHEILRADLCGLLLDATNNLDNVKCRYGDYVTALSQSSTEPTTVTFLSGLRETYDMVVAADGISSKIRSMILDNEALEGSYTFLGQYVAYFSISSRASDTKHWYSYSTTTGLGLMTRPHNNPDTVGVYLMVTETARGKRNPLFEKAMDEGVEAQKRVMRDVFAGAGWEAERILEGLETCTDFYMNRAALVKLPVWHSGRTVLLGDAAFAVPGIGTSLAIQSAYQLAGEMSKIASLTDVPKAIEEYAREISPLYTKYAGIPRGIPQIAFPRSEWGMKVRDSMLWFVSATKLYKLLPEVNAADEKDLPEYEWRV